MCDDSAGLSCLNSVCNCNIILNFFNSISCGLFCVLFIFSLEKIEFTPKFNYFQVPRRTLGQTCSLSMPCNSLLGLICSSGYCACNGSMIWNGAACVENVLISRTINETCGANIAKSCLLSIELLFMSE